MIKRNKPPRSTTPHKSPVELNLKYQHELLQPLDRSIEHHQFVIEQIRCVFKVWLEWSRIIQPIWAYQKPRSMDLHPHGQHDDGEYGDQMQNTVLYSKCACNH